MRHKVWLLDRRDAITALTLNERSIPDVHTKMIIVVLTDGVGPMGRYVRSV
jgi:hypothetical protein